MRVKRKEEEKKRKDGGNDEKITINEIKKEGGEGFDFSLHLSLCLSRFQIFPLLLFSLLSFISSISNLSLPAPFPSSLFTVQKLINNKQSGKEKKEVSIHYYIISISFSNFSSPFFPPIFSLLYLFSLPTCSIPLSHFRYRG